MLLVLLRSTTKGFTEAAIYRYFLKKLFKFLKINRETLGSESFY